MNFTDYCIYTKNYSALNTIKEYQKLFSYDMEWRLKDDNGDYSDMIVPALATVGGGYGMYKLKEKLNDHWMEKAKKSGDKQKIKNLELNKKSDKVLAPVIGGLIGLKVSGGIPKLKHHIHSGDKIIKDENGEWHYESDE